VPLRSPDFAPVPAEGGRLQARRAVRLRAVGAGAQFVKQFVERGLDKSGIKLIATGDVTDDDQLNGMGDVVIGVINTTTTRPTTTAPLNKAYVEASRRPTADSGPNFMSVGGYDGHGADLRRAEEDQRLDRREKLIAAMKGAWRGKARAADLDRRRHARHHPEHLTSARSRRSAASSTTSSSRPFPTSRTR
jgi:branched-chain amino acid transport system substrate-binding protein